MSTLLLTLIENTDTVATIGQFFFKIFGGVTWLVVIIMSMIPIIELKGSIPLGINWGMNQFQAASFAFIGCSILSIILVFALKPILDWLKNTKFFQKIIHRLEKSFVKKAKKLEQMSGVDEKTTSIKKTVIFMALLTLFIAIPIPLSGVWTGCAIGIFIGLKRWQVLVSSLLGSLISAILVAFISWVFGAWIDIVFYCMLALASLLFISMVIKISIDIHREKKNEQPFNKQSKENGDE